MPKQINIRDNILLMPDGNIGGGQLVSGVDENTSSTLESDSDERGEGAGIVDTDNIFADVDKGNKDKVTSSTDKQQSDSGATGDESIDDGGEELTLPVVKDVKIDKVDKQQTVKSNVVQDQTQNNQQVVRDYAKFDPEDAKRLKHLTNNQYVHWAARLNELNTEKTARAELQTQFEELRKNPNRVPDSWYEHPEAYTLTPEYQTVANNYDRASSEANHWEQQLINVKSGQPIYNLVVDPQSKQIVPSGPIEINDSNKAALEVRVQAALNRSLQLQSRFQGEAENIQKNFQNTTASISKGYDDYIKPLVDNLMPELKPKKEDVDLAIQGLHPAHRKSVGNLVGTMYSLIKNQGLMIQKLMGNKNTQQRINNDKVKGGPSSKSGVVGGSAKAGQGNGNGGVIDFEETMNELRGE